MPRKRPGYGTFQGHILFDCRRNPAAYAARLAKVAYGPITSPRHAHKAFIAWFGPKGVASMLFALLVLDEPVTNGSLVFDVAAFVILASILAHGLTDTVGARWVARRMDRA